MKKKEKLDVRIWWSKVEWSPCTWRYEAIYEHCPMPVGVVYAYFLTLGMKTKISQAYILDSFVLPGYRRRGIMTAITNEIKKTVDVIISGGSSKAGLGFMKSKNYKLDKDTGIYKLKVKR